MQPYEAEIILENLQHLDRQEWERTRLLMYSNYSIWSKKKLGVQDILSFPWDSNKDKRTGETEITNEDIARLKELSKRWQQTINRN